LFIKIGRVVFHFICKKVSGITHTYATFTQNPFVLKQINRRHFLTLSGLAAPTILQARDWGKPHSSAFPLMISTWDEGKNVNKAGWPLLLSGKKGLDAIEAGAIYIENKINCCVGLGGNPDRDGIVTLDACVMDEEQNCGAVAGLEQIKHPLSVARKLMELTPHVLLVGNGAQQFALEQGFTKEPAKLSDDAEKAYRKWLNKSEYKPVINIENQGSKQQHGPFSPYFFEDGSANHDTMGMLAMDANGNFSGGVTTSGMAFKLHGRVGDSAGIGAGLFVDNEAGAATSSGVGEEVVRVCGTHLIVELMRNGLTPEKACQTAIERIVKRNPKKMAEIQVGFVAVNKKGEVGAYAIQKGFVYAVKNKQRDEIVAAPSLF
jgi:N4-(beta-N-acetylglucosaminyl)-L-asparaginase